MIIRQDLKKHFLAGVIITAAVSLIAGYFIGFMIAVLAGAAKEYYDQITGKGTPELVDWVATTAGAIAAVAASIGVSWLWNLIWN